MQSTEGLDKRVVFYVLPSEKNGIWLASVRARNDNLNISNIVSWYSFQLLKEKKKKKIIVITIITSYVDKTRVKLYEGESVYAKKK